MTETLFEIVPLHKPLYKVCQAASNSYNVMFHNFCANNYGLYIQHFIKKIAADAVNSNRFLHKMFLKKSLRKCVQKFMMTDLQLIFLAYYCTANQWKIELNQFSGEFKSQQNQSFQQIEDKSFELFIYLNAFFIKSYLGDKEQFEAIQTRICQQFPSFQSIYQKWILSKPKQLFTITPRTINQLYRRHSQNCQAQSTKKDYNDLVDTLIDLSTSYSIMPNKKGEIKQKEKTNVKMREQLVQSQNVSHKNRNKKNKGQGIYKIHENQLEDSPPCQNFQVLRNNPKRKSSLLFQSLQSLSRKSQQLITENRKKQENNKQIEQQRSREKKPGNKVSLSFKRKQKPNETVLGYIKQPSVLEIVPDSARKDNRSILNQSVIQNNFSFINLRSSRSSKNNSQLPFLWRPSEDSFFDKSKLS